MIGTPEGVTDGVEMIELIVGKNHSGVSGDVLAIIQGRKIVVRILILGGRDRHS